MTDGLSSINDKRPRPCADFIRLEKDVKEGAKSIHEGELLMVKVGVELKDIGDKVDKLDAKMDKQFEKVGTDIEELKMKPAKKWDGLMTVLIALIAGALFGIVVNSLGIG